MSQYTDLKGKREEDGDFVNKVKFDDAIEKTDESIEKFQNIDGFSHPLKKIKAYINMKISMRNEIAIEQELKIPVTHTKVKLRKARRKRKKEGKNPQNPAKSEKRESFLKGLREETSNKKEYEGPGELKIPGKARNKNNPKLPGND